jgi:hypothetical protein
MLSLGDYGHSRKSVRFHKFVAPIDKMDRAQEVTVMLVLGLAGRAAGGATRSNYSTLLFILAGEK